MKTLLFILSCAALLFGLYSMQSAAADKIDISVGKAPIVVELYTSQGCSSCPPAEKALSQLSHHQRIFTLSCHVTYWDYLGWKDTFGNQACNDRQANFMHTQGKRNYYTPQMVVNGVDEFPGHRAGRIKAAIEKATKNPAKPISLTHNNQGKITASLPATTPGTYTLWLFGYQKPAPIDVQRGENRGRTLISTNTVRIINSLGNWDGGQNMQHFDIKNMGNLDGIVLLAQRNKYGPIIASGRLEL